MRVLCWLVRAIAWLLILAAVAMAARDGLAWIDTGAWNSVPLGQVWFDLHPDSLQLIQPAIERHVATWLWNPVMTTILQAPAWLDFLVAGVVLLILGSLRRRGRGKFRSRS